MNAAEVVQEMLDSGLRRLNGSNMFSLGHDCTVSRVVYLSFSRNGVAFEPVFGYRLTEVEAVAWRILEQARRMVIVGAEPDPLSEKIMFLRLRKPTFFDRDSFEKDCLSIEQKVNLIVDGITSMKKLETEADYFALAEDFSEREWLLQGTAGIIANWLLIQRSREDVSAIERIPSQFLSAFDRQFKGVDSRTALLETIGALASSWRN